ncbi:MAG: acetylglutamate kinase [Parvularculaceae bacterium]|nr:acetylglutamate kinase [Parvularculaceae bacterium]
MPDKRFKQRALMLLAGLEEGREVRAYLRRFSDAADGCFAVVKVGGAIVDRGLEPLAEALSLLQALGLPPIVVYGAGPQLNEELSQHGFAEERRDGLRVTPEAAMPLVAKAAGEMGNKLALAMRTFGGASAHVHPGVIGVEAIEPATYGMVGDVKAIDTEALNGLLTAGVVPLISCVHVDSAGRLLNVNADNVANAVAKALSPQKIVFVTGMGGILDGANEIISSINLAIEREELYNAPWLQGGMRHKLQEIDDLLEGLPSSSSVSITNTAGLIRELFTHSGSGTLVRRGELIEELVRVERRDIQPLVEEAFKRTLKETYWDEFSPRYCLLSAKRRAGAVVTNLDGVDVLDKFAVLSAARGEGLAKSLWTSLIAASPQIVWRSRHANPFNAFYHAQADGSVRRGEWTVFWVGRELEARMGALADTLATRPGDFVGET